MATAHAFSKRKRGRRAVRSDVLHVCGSAWHVIDDYCHWRHWREWLSERQAHGSIDFTCMEISHDIDERCRSKAHSAEQAPLFGGAGDSACGPGRCAPAFPE